MAFNKNKALESALKFLNQGKVAQAIGEYQQILRHDPKDQATLMTVGDLFARQGDMSQAIEYFERLAQVYLSDGFNSKAIAIYKKIAKLAPQELAPLERLADLYVQQGVLSEARPLFLQIAEAHLKANKAQKAVEVLHRLLDVEPENPRVQMRLAELYNVMGQKKEAAQTYFNYAQRLFDRGDQAEAAKLIERALEVEPGHADALLLKGKVLSDSTKPENAVSLLEQHPEADAGGEVTQQLVEAEIKGGHFDKAADRARKQLARGHEHTALMVQVTDAQIEAGQAAEALALLRELRDPMIDAGEQDKFLKSLSLATERLPGKTEPLEMAADFCRHTSDPFRLADALSKLSDLYAAQGNFPRAEELLEELVDKNRGDERLVERLENLRARANGGAPPKPKAQTPAPVAVPEPPAQPETIQLTEESATPAAFAGAEEPLDDETQKYIAQALTDVDLFSSYGLTQKATHLLESVLERAPRHTPTLERLLDLYLGAGNERRTAEMAAQLEQIHRERGDAVNAERFSELRQRFQKVAGISSDELPPAPPPPAAPAAPVAATPQAHAVAAPEVDRATARTVAPAPPPAAAPAEFEISIAPAEPEEEAAPAHAAQSPAAPVAEAAPPAAQEAEEVDLSDEWEAMVKDVDEPAAAAESAPAAEPEPAELAPQAMELDPVVEAEAPAEPAEEAVHEPVHVEAHDHEAELAEIHNLAEQALHSAVSHPAVEVGPESVPVDEEVDVQPAEEKLAEPVAAESTEFELELAPEPAAKGAKSGPTTTDDFLSELAAEIDDMEVPSTDAQPVAAAVPAKETRMPPPAAMPVAAPPAAQVAASVAGSSATGGLQAPLETSPVGTTTAESLNELAEVFQEFRDELGEMGEEEEDLETHYNLGIAYREMGLLDEAIGEFQKVAKAVQNGKPFPYAMNCSTLLALTFMDKSEPKIASLWYKRALETPRLEPETVLALRYDLGVALEMAGESTAALDSFRQVYAMNIDYRDVAEHIAALQKH
jgi:tetratricopeptide (TPR) repeat protein